MIVGSYTLHLYCDNEDRDQHRGGYYDFDACEHFPIEYVADGPNSYSLVRKAAKKEGWLLKRDGTAICPKCNKKL